MKKILIASMAAAALTAAVAMPASAGVVEPVGLVYAPHDCTTPKKKPNRITLACGDSNALLKKMEWSEWGGEKAEGTGWFAINDCKPDCAGGHFISYGADVKLKKIETGDCGGQTVDLYTVARITFIGEVPPHANNLAKWQLACNA